MSKQWKLLPQKSNNLVEQLLINRGVKTTLDKKRFFNPKIKDVKKDLEIPGISKSLERIKKALKNGEQMIVYGDFDVDGITASAIVYKSLTSLGAKILPYIPHREKEGYGLSKEGLEFCRDSGASLIITVDHGIVALEMAKFAKEIGLDLVITDHHMPVDKKPEAYSIVHSTKMCGAAIAWCLMRRLIKKELTEELLELVALATVCDLIPLLGLNRSFVYQGLKEINQTKNIGIKALLLESGIELGEIDSYTLGHVLGPRLNAIGRVEHAIDALRLLCTKDPLKARRLASLLSSANLKRQQLTEKALEEARAMIHQGDGIHVLYSKDWIPGIIGLIASRVVEETNTPALAISVTGELAKGSARSPNGISIIELIRSCSDLLIDVGGHKGAAGFSLETKKIAVFKKRLVELMVGQVADERVLEIEAEVKPSELTKKLALKLGRFEPFGLGNPQPLLASYSMEVSDTRTLKEGKHLKFRANGVDCIGFSLGHLLPQLRNDQKVDLAYNLEINKFNGEENLQLKIKDIRIN